MKRILVALVENKPGVLNRVTSLFRRRCFNIDSLTVGRTESPEYSRMTIVVDREAEKVRLQLKKLINVVEVEDITDQPGLSRDLALVKVKTSTESRQELLRQVSIFRANVVHLGAEEMIVELTGSAEKIDAAVEMLRPYEILEMVRTGVVSMARAQRSLPVPRAPQQERRYTNVL